VLLALPRSGFVSGLRLGLALLLFFPLLEKVIDFPAYFVSQTAQAGTRSGGYLAVFNLLFQDLFDQLPDFIKQDVIYHQRDNSSLLSISKAGGLHIRPG